jgi:outer membrane biogenesis lipoprotein LolB
LNLKELVDRYEKALLAWDDAYIKVLDEAQSDGVKLTEEKLRVATRNELRQHQQEIPEVLRWRMRAAIGYRSEEDDGV